MGTPTEDAEQAIRELARRQLAGEIDDESFREQSLPHAAILAAARDAAPIPPATDWRSLLAAAIERAERDPAAVQAAVAGIIHGLGHYVRSQPRAE